MGRLKVVQLKVGPMDNFVYLLLDGDSKEAMAVDSGWETGPLVKAARTEGANVKHAVATHGHFDHTSTLRELADELGAKVVAHSSSPVEHDISVSAGQELAIGSSKVAVMHTPGHTEDGICLYDGREVFTGDTLFFGTKVAWRGESIERLPAGRGPQPLPLNLRLRILERRETEMFPPLTTSTVFSPFSFLSGPLIAASGEAPAGSASTPAPTRRS